MCLQFGRRRVAKSRPDFSGRIGTFPLFCDYHTHIYSSQQITLFESTDYISTAIACRRRISSVSAMFSLKMKDLSFDKSIANKTSSSTTTAAAADVTSIFYLKSNTGMYKMLSTTGNQILSQKFYTCLQFECYYYDLAIILPSNFQCLLDTVQLYEHLQTL
jgi:hypothetical protein